MSLNLICKTRILCSSKCEGLLFLASHFPVWKTTNTSNTTSNYYLIFDKICELYSLKLIKCVRKVALTWDPVHIQSQTHGLLDLG